MLLYQYPKPLLAACGCLTTASGAGQHVSFAVRTTGLKAAYASHADNSKSAMGALETEIHKVKSNNLKQALAYYVHQSCVLASRSG